MKGKPCKCRAFVLLAIIPPLPQPGIYMVQIKEEEAVKRPAVRNLFAGNQFVDFLLGHWTLDAFEILEQAIYTNDSSHITPPARTSWEKSRRKS